jgi:hypothetical protein
VGCLCERGRDSASEPPHFSSPSRGPRLTDEQNSLSPGKAQSVKGATVGRNGESQTCGEFRVRGNTDCACNVGKCLGDRTPESGVCSLAGRVPIGKIALLRQDSCKGSQQSYCSTERCLDRCSCSVFNMKSCAWRPGQDCAG